MKRIGAIVALAVFLFVMTAGACFAANDSLKIKEVYPKDGAKGTSVDNLSIKLYFDRDVIPKNKDIKKSNEKAFKLVDEKGKEIDIMVKYNPDKKKKGQVIVLANAISATSGDKKSKKTRIQSNTKYTFTINKDFVATDGKKLSEDKKISFTTVNQSQATKIQMLLMGVMIAVMVIMSMRSQKKQQQKEEEMKKNKKNDKVNPYKMAKSTGKSVEEIVREDKEKKAKKEQAAEKRRAKEEKQRQKIEEHIRKKYGSDNYRVHTARPISEAGSTYVAPTKKVEEVQPESKPKTKSTNPKNKSGKQKNKKK